MDFSSDIQIREQLARYFAGEIPLQEFEDWFVPFSWNIVHEKNLAAINLVYEIELLLAEFSHGHWHEDELRANLLPLVKEYKIAASQEHWQSGVSNHVVQWYQSPPSSDIQYEVEYV